MQNNIQYLDSLVKLVNNAEKSLKKGKLDKHAIWLVEIDMPKKLIQDIYSGYDELLDYMEEPATGGQSHELGQAPADAAAAETGIAPMPAPGGEEVPAEAPPVEGGAV